MTDALQDYVDAFGVQLEEALRAQDARTRARSLRSIWADRIPRRWPAVAVAALAAACLAVIALATTDRGTSTAAALPILRTPAVDVTARQRVLQAPASRPLDLAHAHAFRAPRGGRGYVMTSTDGRTLCLALPDATEGYGVTCAPLATVEAKGLVGMLVSVTRKTGPSQVAAVLPKGTEAAAIVGRDGRTQALPVDQGVAAGSVEADGELRFPTPSGRVRSIPVRAYEPDNGPAYIGCKGGKTFRVPKGTNTEDPALRLRLCGDES
jgi:hypothetical protein